MTGGEGGLQRRLTGAARAGRTNAVPMVEEFEEDAGLGDADYDVPPPAYGEHHDQLQFSHAGVAADAAVTTAGRVNIHLSEKNSRLSELLAPTLQRQLRPEPSAPLPPPYIPPSLGGHPGQTPPPRLNVVIQIVGSRGDVQPFVALGQVLRDTYGHRVRLATHATFRSLVEENGLEFFNIGGDPAQLMAFMVKNPGLMPGLDALKNGDIKRRRREIEEILLGCWRSCIEAGDGMGVAPPPHKRDDPLDERFLLPGGPGSRPFVADAIIANPPSFAGIHIAEFEVGNPATHDVHGLGDVINRFRVSVLGLEHLSLLWAPGLLNRLRIPTTYCWSPSLTPKPADWMPEVTVSGFFFLDLESNYTPEPELVAFLAAGPAPVYIGFGSIVVDDPDGLTNIIFSAVIKAGVRAVVSKGWGGIGCDAAGIPEGVFMLGNCPHDWLFKHSWEADRGGAVLWRPDILGHHGREGRGGPAPIPHKKLTAENLAAAIEHALLPETQARARELGERIKREKGADVGGKSFHQFLNTDNMRCSLAPSRVAVWRVRRSQVRLSALAAAVLVKKGWLKYSDLKLYRSIEYDTDEQPWDPISAVLTAIVGDVGALTMAVADFPREVFKVKKKGKERAECNTEAARPHDGTPEAATPDYDCTGSRPRTPGFSPPSAARAPAETLSISQPSSSAAPLTPPPPAGSGSVPDHSQEEPDASTPMPANLDAAIAAGQSASRIVGAGFSFYANTCLGLARGFRNAPKLYNDETVRPLEKVTGFTSGVRVAGKELGMGLYDGTTGLFTQPWKGAQKEGAKGLVKGFGKGIGGFFLKNSSAVMAGEEEYSGATAEEREDVLARWQTLKDELKGFYLLKQREGGKTEKGKAAAAATTAGEAESGSPTEWLNAVRDGAKAGRLNLSGGLWGRRHAGSSSGGGATTATTDSPSSTLAPAPASSSSSNLALGDDESLERAIQESVVRTSTGDREEDALVEAAVRASVMEMRRAVEQQRQQQPPPYSGQSWIPDQKLGHADGATAEKAAMTSDEWTEITDEEYQALIEEAVRRSLLEQRQRQQQEKEKEEFLAGRGDVLPRPEAAVSSTTTAAAARPRDEREEEEQLRLAMEESEREQRGREAEDQRQRTEEEIVLEYVKRQSLAEEEYRRKKMMASAAGQERGESSSNGAVEGRAREEDEEDEELRRAIEESLRDL
ncbi:hypothetical protein VTH06DRAFT_8131 [Thermothelomyces fergusii]